MIKKIDKTDENQLYFLVYTSDGNVDRTESYYTTDMGKVLNALKGKGNNKGENWFRVFTIPQWEEIKDAEVILKKAKA